MVTQAFRTVDVLRLEVETDPTGLTNMVQNPSGELGGWGWVTPVAGSAMGTAFAPLNGVSTRGLHYTAAGAVPNHFYTEPLPITAGEYAAASWIAYYMVTGGVYRVRFEWLSPAFAVLSSTVQTGYTDPSASTVPYGPHQAPAGAAYVRLRFDYYLNNTGANVPSSNYRMIFREVTVAKAATSAELGSNRTNLIPNPSLETDLKGWVASAGTVLERDTALATAGVASLRFRSSGIANLRAQTIVSPITGGATYTLSADLRRTAGITETQAQLWWYASLNGTGTPLSWTAVTPSMVADTWTRANLTAVAPSAAKSVSVEFYFGAGGGGVASGERAYVDAALLERAEAPDSYFDGDTPDAGGWGYAWTTQPPQVVTRTNLVTNPAPASTATYTPNAGAATVSLVSGWLRVQAISTTSTDSFAAVGGDAGGGLRLGMQAGKTYTISAERGSTNKRGDLYNTTRHERIVVLHRIGAAAYTIATSALGSGRQSVTFTLPAGTTEAFIRLYNGSADPYNTGPYYTDWRNVMLEEAGTAGGYFSGSTADATVDYTAYDRAWTGTANASTSTETATTTLPASTAISSNLAFTEPIQYLDILGESHEIRIQREELNLGTLTATVLSSSLDPATSGLIRPGRRVRLRASSDAETWDPVFTGQLLEAEVRYELKDPAIPEEKRARVTITAADAAQTLANAQRPEGVETLEELPYVLEGAGVPWDVLGSGSQVPAATVTTHNESASALDQIALTRDTQLGYAWVSRAGVLTVADGPGLPDELVTLDESAYTDLDLSFSTKDCINEVMVTVQSAGAAGETTETTYGPYRDAASIAEWGRYRKDFTVTGLDLLEVEALAASILAANATPRVRANSLALPILTAEHVSRALIDLYTPARIVNAARGVDDQLRVTALEHVIETNKWISRLTFADEGGVAQPTAQPPVQSGARPDVGVLELFAGPTSAIPPGKLLCDGASYPRAEYPYLWAVIGYTFGGAGDFFNVPNLTDRFPIGAGTKAVGSIGGAATKPIEIANLPGHTHSTPNHTHPGINVSSNTLEWGSGGTAGVQSGATAGVRASGSQSITVNSGGASSTGPGSGTKTPLDILNPWISINYVIRAA